METFDRRRRCLPALLALLLLPVPVRAEDPIPSREPHGAKGRAAEKREADRRDAASLGIVEVVRGEPVNAPRPSPWWTREDLAPSAATVDMWTERIGEPPGGLALSGVGEAGGGSAAGLPQEGVETVGHGEGIDDLDAVDHRIVDPDGAYLTARSRLEEAAASYESHARARAETAPKDRPIPEAIQRIVRKNFGAIRLCYDRGLRRSAALHGRVAVRFTIEPSGSVSVAADRDSDLPDTDVITCVVRSFLNLSFPPSKSGSVTVVYPLRLSPSGLE